MDILANYICSPNLPDAYSNVASRESAPTSSDAKAVEEKVYAEELDTLVDNEVRDLTVDPDASLYDGTKSIKQAYLLSFF